MEVMGLMLGEFVDDYTVNCIDVFAMPQSGTGVSVEAVDPVFQMKMLEMLKQTGRSEMVVGWYHSHPGFGCWLSGVDINTQQSFEALNPRAVAVVVDPIQSVKGKVVIDAFRLINPQLMMMGQEPRQTTSNIGHLNKPSIQALIHGLNRHYYSIAIDYRKNELEEQMLMNLHKKTWSDGLVLAKFEDHSKENETTVKVRAWSSGCFGNERELLCDMLSICLYVSVFTTTGDYVGSYGKVQQARPGGRREDTRGARGAQCRQAGSEEASGERRVRPHGPQHSPVPRRYA